MKGTLFNTTTRTSSTLAAAIVVVAAVLFSACGKSDDQLKSEIESRLAGVSVEGVSVAVDKGTVRLTGQVSEQEISERAERMANIEGVVSVQNEIVVRNEDSELRERIEAGLREADITGVTVTVTDGQATLSGTVPIEQLAEAMIIAETAGAANVVNRLTN